MTSAAQFGIVDYIVFLLTLGISVCIGIYFAFFGAKKKSEEEYLYGSKQMKAIPVGLSLYSSAISAVSIIGMPVEIYYNGTQYLISIVGGFLGIFVIWIVILPVFCGNLNIKTPYEYFERRFDTRVKLLSSVIYIIYAFLLMPVILYAPSMALSQATNIPLWLCTSTIGTICILYTTFGGFKTVIWTDALQATLMLLSNLVITLIALRSTGGLSEVWAKADEGGRIQFFNMDPNPLVRTTFWTGVIGLIFLHCSHSAVTAGALQRYMSLRNEKQARISTCVGFIGTSSIHIISGLTGIIIYAKYGDCDPVLNKNVNSPNEILPYFVSQTISHIPGFTGFFIAGLLCAALSTLSSELNMIGGIIYYDFITRFWKSKFIDSNGTHIMKIIVICNGVIYLICSPLIRQSKHIYELALSVGGITYGAKLGMLFLGILFPKSNAKGVITGAITSMLVMLWTNYGAHFYHVNAHYKLPTSTDECPILNTTTMSSISNFTTISNELNITCNSHISNEPAFEDIFFLYRVSYLYYCLLGTFITVFVGLIVSYCTGTNKHQNIDPVYVAPFLRSYIKKQNKLEMEM